MIANRFVTGLLLSLAAILIPSSFAVGDDIDSELEVAEQCAACHEQRASGLEGSPHALPAPEDLAAGPPLGSRQFCQDCHVDPARHLEEPGPETASRVTDMSPATVLAVCGTCHSSQHVLEFEEGNLHFESGLTCTSCHKMHFSRQSRLLKKSSVKLCLECHSSISELFHLPSHHPVKEGNLRCVDCHHVLDTFDRPFSLETSRAVCVSCHTEYEGPFPYEHEALNDYALEEHGCLSCHEAHGSVNRKLLKQPGEGLCMQCHIVPGHFTAHGGIWADRRCQECHADIHGSYSSEKLFGEDMRISPCFQTGCHSY
jgi:DmsE family decaheme c-type cytochrome